MEEKQIYTWLEFDEDMNKMATWARPWNFKSIYGIPRGGLVPAVKLSHILDIPMILNREDITSDTLIVDDIVDKGSTLERFLSSIGKSCRTSSIFLNESSSFKPDFSARKKEHWVIFAWETEASSRYDGTILGNI